MNSFYKGSLNDIVNHLQLFGSKILFKHGQNCPGRLVQVFQQLPDPQFFSDTLLYLLRIFFVLNKQRLSIFHLTVKQVINLLFLLFFVLAL